MSDIFISYSRRDLDFVHQVVDALNEDPQMDIFIDWKMEPGDEGWLKEIHDNIELCGTLVFVMTKDSLCSLMCNLECAYARAQKRRFIVLAREDINFNNRELINTDIIGVLDSRESQLRGESAERRALEHYHQDVDAITDLARGNHRSFRHYNWIMCRDSDNFAAAVQQLIQAIKKDSPYIRAESWLKSRAKGWDEHERQDEALLRGSDLERAAKWLKDAAERGLQPDPLIMEYISRSQQRELREMNAKRQQERRNRNFAIGAAAVLCFLLALAVIFSIQSQVNLGLAEQRGTEAAGFAATAANNAATAIAAQMTAQYNEQQAISRQQAANALLLLDSDPALALARALAANAIAAPPIESQRALASVAYDSRLRFSLGGDDGAVQALAVSGDGLMIAAGTADARINRWNLGTGEQLPVISAGDQVVGIGFHPNGEVLVAATVDGRLTAWHLASRSRARVVSTELSLSYLAVSAGGLVLAGDADGTIVLWDGESDQPVGEPLVTGSPVVSVAFSPDGQSFITGGVDGVVTRWDVATRASTQQLQGHLDVVTAVAFDPSGDLIVSASVDNSLIVWDAVSGEHLQLLRGHGSAVLDAAFSPDSRLIASASDDGDVILWETNTGEAIQTFSGHADAVTRVAFAMGGARVISASNDATVQAWDLDSGAIARRFAGHQDMVLAAAISPDGQHVLTASCAAYNNALYCVRRDLIVWDMLTGAASPPSLSDGQWIRSIAYSPDGTRFATGSCARAQNEVCTRGELLVWDANSMELILPPLAGHRGDVYQVAFSPDGQRLLSAGSDGLVMLWNAATGERVYTFNAGKASGVEATSLSFSADGHAALAGYSDGTLVLWNVTDQRQIRAFGDTTDRVLAVALSPVEPLAASGSFNGEITLWNTERGAVEATFTDHSAGVTGIAFSPDGRYIVSGSADRALILWDVAARLPLRIYRGHRYGVTSVGFTPDGRGVISSGEEGSLIHWRIDSLAELRDWIAQNRYWVGYPSMP